MKILEILELEIYQFSWVDPENSVMGVVLTCVLLFFLLLVLCCCFLSTSFTEVRTGPVPVFLRKHIATCDFTGGGGGGGAF